MKQYGIWCSPKNGSENGKWLKRNSDPLLFDGTDAADKKCARISLYDLWMYQVREYQR